MRPIKLVMSAWGPYSQLTEVDFEKFTEDNLFLITGPTGAGKTTIFDAISFALYGDVSGKVREKTSLRSDFAKEAADTFVILEFFHKGTLYKIKRSPKYERQKKRGQGVTVSVETAELYEGEFTPVASVMEVNKKLNEIMGISYGQFKQIAMIAQGEFMELLLAGSRERVEIFRNLFKTDLYEKLQKSLSEKSKNLFNQINELNHRMEEDAKQIDAGYEETLKELLVSEHPRYEKICDLTQELILQESKKQEEIEKGILAKETKSKDLVGKILEGENLNKRLQLLQESVSELEVLRTQQEEVSALEQKLKTCDLAQKLTGDEKIFQKISTDLKKVKEEQMTIGKAVCELEPRFEESKRKEKENEGLAFVLEELKEKSRELKTYLPLVEELDVSRKSQEQKRKEILKLQKKEEELKQNIHLLESEKQSHAEEVDQYEDTAVLIGNINLKISKEERKIQDIEKSLEQYEKFTLEQTQLVKLQKQYEEVSVWMKEKRKLYEEKEELFQRATAGLLARQLLPDQPCPVCGSTEHPRIAEVPLHVPDEMQLKLYKSEYEKVEKKVNDIVQKAATQKGMVDTSKMQLLAVLKEFPIQQEEELIEISNIQTLYYKTKEELNETKFKKDVLVKQLERKTELLQWMNELTERINLLKNQKEENVLHCQVMKSEEDILTGTITGIKAKLPADFFDSKRLKEQLKETLDRMVIMDATMNNSKKEYEKLKNELLKVNTLLKKNKEDCELLTKEEEEERRKFVSKVTALGFADVEDYRKALLDEEEYSRMTGKVKKYYQEIQAKEEQIKNLKEETKEKQAVPTEVLREGLEKEENEKRLLQLQKEEIKMRIQINKKALASINDKKSCKEKLEEEYGVIKDLDNVTKGHNPERVVFEHYVLSAYFEDILQSANRRLLDMTGGRYELLKVDKVSDARTKDSLDLEVLDYYTGRKRSVKTLSGGESFKAALALALGLSDVVQNNAGGIQIDTLFVDEGFGSLDDESLNQALNTLTNLTRNNRLIGIISHVNELKERIDNQIMIEKGNRGSTVYIDTAKKKK